MLHRFEDVPAVGTVMLVDDQRYDLVLVEPYVRKDGEESWLLSWTTNCVQCDEPFLTQSGLAVGSVNRRCIKHKRPGCRVNKSRRRGLPLSVSIEPPAGLAGSEAAEPSPAGVGRPVS